MNISHLIAIIKIRWQITYNQWKKAGRTNAIVTAIFAGLAVLGAVAGFFVTVFAGNAILGDLKPNYLMFTVDVLVAAFLFAWIISLIAEVQRSELLSLENLLHLPVSLSGAFILNYLSSWVCLSILFVLPLILGLCIALPMTHGLSMLTAGPLAFSFLVMVTGVTYQLRGWLSRLMQNKRKRGTVIVGLTIGMVTLCQLPQMFNMMNSRKQSAARTEWRESTQLETAALTQRIQDEEISAADGQILLEELEVAQQQRRQARRDARFAETSEYVVLANKVLPPAWFPFGIRSAAMGNVAVPLLCSSGMLLIGCCSLMMSYRSTMQVYTKASTRQFVADDTTEVSSLSADSDRGGFLEKTIPRTSPQTSVIALASFRSLMRAPESKAALLMPLIFMLMFGGMGITTDISVIPVVARPLAGMAVMAMVMFGLAQFTTNMFGLDRNGFKSYIMMPVERWRVLLGKNLSLIPFVVAMALVLLLILQIILPLQLSHFVASVLQVIPVCLAYLIMGNYVSTICPVAMTYGSMKPAQPKIKTMLLQALFVFLTPLLILPASIAYGIEFAVHKWIGAEWLPVYLLLTVIESVLMVLLYSRVLRRQGQFLQKREQRILAVVISQNE